MTARLVSAAIVYKLSDGRVVKHAWLTDVAGEQISAQAQGVHGISTSFAHAYGEPLQDVVTELTSLISSLASSHIPVAAYNASFDFTLLHQEAVRAGLDSKLPVVVDPFVLDLQLNRHRPGSRTLESVAKAHDIQLRSAHDATEDATATLRLAEIFLTSYPDVKDIPLHELQVRQREWHAANQESFASRVATLGGTTEHVRYGWPLDTRAAEAS